MGIELEWKYDLSEALPDGDLLSWPPVRRRMAETPRLYCMRTTYYDTADRTLSSRRITLRCRLENNQPVICVKAPLPAAAEPVCSAGNLPAPSPAAEPVCSTGNLPAPSSAAEPVCSAGNLPAPSSAARREWELPGSDPAAALPELIRLGAPPELAAIRRLVPVCGAAFVRTAVLLRFSDGSAAELALDHGTLFGAARSVPLHVLELELKEGAPDEPLAFAEALAARFALAPQPRSKYARARAL